MIVRGFLKPTFGKLVLAIVLATLASLFMYDYLLNHTSVCAAIGCPTVQEVAKNDLFSFYIPLFLAVGYIFSCLIVLGYRKARGNAFVA